LSLELPGALKVHVHRLVVATRDPLVDEYAGDPVTVHCELRRELVDSLPRLIASDELAYLLKIKMSAQASRRLGELTTRRQLEQIAQALHLVTMVGVGLQESDQRSLDEVDVRAGRPIAYAPPVDPESTPVRRCSGLDGVTSSAAPGCPCSR